MPARIRDEGAHRGACQLGTPVRVPAGTPPLDEGNQGCDGVDRMAPAAVKGKVGECTRQGGQAHQARATLSGALAGEITDNPRCLGEPA
jgi:hypothetical protein